MKISPLCVKGFIPSYKEPLQDLLWSISGRMTAQVVMQRWGLVEPHGGWKSAMRSLGSRALFMFFACLPVT